MPLRHRLFALTLASLLTLAAFACDSGGGGVVPPNQRPTTSVVVTPSDPTPGQLITIDASGSRDLSRAGAAIHRIDIVIRDVAGKIVQSQSGTNPVMTFTAPAGAFSISVLVVDEAGEASGETINIVVSNCGASPTLGSNSLPNAIVGQAYDVFLPILGGFGTVSAFKATASTLPEGLSLGVDGHLTGTPAGTAAGDYAFQVLLRDSCDVKAREFLTTVFLTVENPSGGCDPLSISSGAPPDANSGVSYSFGLATLGGFAPITFSIPGGGLPTGLVLSGNSITGVPTTTSVFAFAIQARDSCPTGAQTVLQGYTIRVN